MAKKDEYPKMLFRSDELFGARPVFGKEGVFYTTVGNAKEEAAAKAAGYRTTVRAKK